MIKPSARPVVALVWKQSFQSDPVKGNRRRYLSLQNETGVSRALLAESSAQLLILACGL